MAEIRYHEGDIPASDAARYAGAIAVDTETLGLVPRRDRLCVVQLSPGDGSADVIRIAKGQSSAPNLVAMLADPAREKIFHYGRFDIAILFHTFGVTTTPVFCTKIASRLARTYTDRHGLKDNLKELLEIDISKAQQQTDWAADVLSQAQLEYAASDVLHLHALRDKLRTRLARENRIELADAWFDRQTHAMLRYGRNAAPLRQAWPSCPIRRRQQMEHAMLPPVLAAVSSNADHPSVQAVSQSRASTPVAPSTIQAPEDIGEVVPIARGDILSLSAQLKLAQNFSIFAETIGKLLSMPRAEGEGLIDYTERLSKALQALTPADRAMVERLLTQIVKGISLRLLGEILKDPAGPQAARLAVRIETANQAERELKVKAAVNSYRQNAPAEVRETALPAPAPRSGAQPTATVSTTHTPMQLAPQAVAAPRSELAFGVDRATVNPSPPADDSLPERPSILAGATANQPDKRVPDTPFARLLAPPGTVPQIDIPMQEALPQLESAVQAAKAALPSVAAPAHTATPSAQTAAPLVAAQEAATDAAPHLDLRSASASPPSSVGLPLRAEVPAQPSGATPVLQQPTPELVRAASDLFRQASRPAVLQTVSDLTAWLAKAFSPVPEASGSVLDGVGDEVLFPKPELPEVSRRSSLPALIALALSRGAAGAAEAGGLLAALDKAYAEIKRQEGAAGRAGSSIPAPPEAAARANRAETTASIQAPALNLRRADDASAGEKADPAFTGASASAAAAAIPVPNREPPAWPYTMPYPPAQQEPKREDRKARPISALGDEEDDAGAEDHASHHQDRQSSAGGDKDETAGRDETGGLPNDDDRRPNDLYWRMAGWS
eukprot:g25388.t1